jgi:hypothetical protein
LRAWERLVGLSLVGAYIVAMICVGTRELPDWTNAYFLSLNLSVSLAVAAVVRIAAACKVVGARLIGRRRMDRPEGSGVGGLMFIVLACALLLKSAVTLHELRSRTATPHGVIMWCLSFATVGIVAVRAAFSSASQLGRWLRVAACSAGAALYVTYITGGGLVGSYSPASYARSYLWQAACYMLQSTGLMMSAPLLRAIQVADGVCSAGDLDARAKPSGG